MLRRTLKIGDPIRKTIYDQIRVYEKLLLIFSEESVESEWVGDEVEAAFEEEKRRKRLMLFPIRLDGVVMDTGTDWAAKIRRTRHIGDFTNWKDHDAYQEAFGRLIRDLRQEPPIDKSLTLYLNTMATEPTPFKIRIAPPGDVSEERQFVRIVVDRLRDQNSHPTSQLRHLDRRTFPLELIPVARKH